MVSPVLHRRKCIIQIPVVVRHASPIRPYSSAFSLPRFWSLDLWSAAQRKPKLSEAESGVFPIL